MHQQSSSYSVRNLLCSVFISISLMGEEPNTHQPNTNLPPVLLLRPFPFIPSYNQAFSTKFHSINPLPSPTLQNFINLDRQSLHTFLTTHAQPVRALICSAHKPLSNETLRCLPSLELIITTSTGVEHVDLDECRRRGISVVNTGTVYTEDVADLAVGLLLSVLRKVAVADYYVRRRLWPSNGDFPLGTTVGGKRVGIVGLGNIGTAVAKRLEAFGCIISYNSKKKKPSAPYAYHSNVRDLAASNDILIVCCAFTDETWHIVNKDVLSALGKDGVVINVGRGRLIDEKELVRCLAEGEIGGAGLDVFENEPSVPQELFELNNVVLSPHKAVNTLETRSALHDYVIANLEAFFSNKPLLSTVSYE